MNDVEDRSREIFGLRVYCNSYIKNAEMNDVENRSRDILGLRVYCDSHMENAEMNSALGIVVTPTAHI